MNHLLERAHGIRAVCRRCRPDEHVEVVMVKDTPLRVYAFKEGHPGIAAAAREGVRVARLSHLSTVPQIYTALSKAADELER